MTNEPKRTLSGPGYHITLANPQPGDLNDAPIGEALNHLRRELSKSRRALRNTEEKRNGPAMEKGPDGRMHVFDCQSLSIRPSPCDERECGHWRKTYGIEEVAKGPEREG